MNKAFFLAIAVFLCSCSTSNIRGSYKLSSAHDSGVVSGSITRDGGYSEYRVYYRQIPSGESGYFNIGQANIIIPYFPNDFDDPHAKGELFAAELPAGLYELYSWGVASGSTSIGHMDPFSIRFRVEPGQAIYIGNVHFTQLKNRGLTVTGVRVSYLDKSARDIPLLETRFPALAPGVITSAVLPNTEINNLGGSTATHTTSPPVFIPVH